jgi:hypothetical protein
MLKKMILLAFVVTLFLGCDKDETDSAARLPVPPTTTTSYPSGGFILGTVNGTRANGDSFQFSFNHVFYERLDEMYFYENSYMDSIFCLSMHRIESGNVPAPALNGDVYLNFESSSSFNAFTPESVYADFFFAVDLGNGEILRIDGFPIGQLGDPASQIVVTAFNFDPVTRIASGDITATLAPDRFNGISAVIELSFQSNPMFTFVNRMNPTGK